MSIIAAVARGHNASTTLLVDGEIIFYDYCQENINIKRNIVEMNMSIEEIKFFSKTINHPFLFKGKKIIQKTSIIINK